MKRKNAAESDSILNKLETEGQDTLEKPARRLTNLILKEKTIPMEWKESEILEYRR